MKNIEFIWNKKCAIYIGRFQPFHEGHKKIVEKAIKKYGQVAILVMNSFGVDKKNPYNYSQVTRKIRKNLKEYKNCYVIIKIPPIFSSIYGRKVGYKFEKIKLSKKLQDISATKIRDSSFK